MKLVIKGTQVEAVIGNTYKGKVLNYFRPPHKPGSSGKASEKDGYEYFVGVFGLEWIQREDRGWKPDEESEQMHVHSCPKCSECIGGNENDTRASLARQIDGLFFDCKDVRIKCHCGTYMDCHWEWFNTQTDVSIHIKDGW